MSPRAYTVRPVPTNELRIRFWWALMETLADALPELYAGGRRGVPAWLKRYRLTAPWCRELALRQLALRSIARGENGAPALVAGFEGDDPIPAELDTFAFRCRGWWPYKPLGGVLARAGIAVDDAGSDVAGEHEEWPAADKRIRAEFERALARYRDAVTNAARARGWAAKRATEKHLAWLVRYLCGGESVYSISHTAPPAPREIADKETVRDAIRDTAAALGLDLPEIPPPG